jgi:hypothetical protein
VPTYVVLVYRITVVSFVSPDMALASTEPLCLGIRLLVIANTPLLVVQYMLVKSIYEQGKSFRRVQKKVTWEQYWSSIL